MSLRDRLAERRHLERVAEPPPLMMWPDPPPVEVVATAVVEPQPAPVTQIDRNRHRVQPESTPFGRLLRSYRRAAGVAQGVIADKANLDHSCVSKLESGTRMPSLFAVDRLAEALSLSMDERAALRVAAGFPPDAAPVARVANPLLGIAHEPVIGAALDVLQDATLPAAVREAMREQIAGAVRLARLAVKVGGKAA